MRGGGGGGQRGRNVQIPVMALTPTLFYGESSSVLTGGYSDDCAAVVSSTLFPAASGLFGQRPLAGQPLQNLLVLDKVPGGPTLQASLQPSPAVHTGPNVHCVARGNHWPASSRFSCDKHLF